MSLKKVALINLGILLVYTLITNVTASGQEAGLQVMIVLAMIIVAHVAINIFISLVHFISKNNVAGRNYLLSALIVLVIGFSACFGSASLY